MSTIRESDGHSVKNCDKVTYTGLDPGRNVCPDKSAGGPLLLLMAVKNGTALTRKHSAVDLRSPAVYYPTRPEGLALPADWIS